MILFSHGTPETRFSREDVRRALQEALGKLGKRRKVIALPPDFTRFHSQAGLVTELVWEYFGSHLTDILPAIGTHMPMSPREIDIMFGPVPRDLFRVHDWKSGLTTLGEVPAPFVKNVSEERVDYAIPIQVDSLVAKGGHDLILSIGQIVPHEVIGMAGYNKNVFIGTGGAEAINKTHFLGAAYGMERIMGRTDTPVRRVLNYGSTHFAGHLPILYVLTVVGKDEKGELAIRGLYIGDEETCFQQAAALSLKINFELLDHPLRKVVVYLDPDEFKSTWLGNKSVYRTRMAIADDGELIVLAPGLAQFGEDPGIDVLIRKYGYVGTPRVLSLVRENEDLQKNLSAAAHLIHGSSEGRFTITYCPGNLTQREIESVQFRYADLQAMLKRYDPAHLKDGPNTLPDGEEIFYISNPALGLWSYREHFE
jgi:nickel-dependent lactate racemase